MDNDMATRKPAAKSAKSAKSAVAKRPVGRPTIYSDKLALEICERVANGERLTRICKEPGMPKFSTIYDWETETIEVNGVHSYKYPIFAEGLARARISFAEFQVLEAGDLIDDAGVPLLNQKTGKPIKDEKGNVVTVLSHEAVAHTRSQANYRQWMAERIHARYRPKSTVEQTGPNGGPLLNANVNANFDKADLEKAFKELLDKGV